MKEAARNVVFADDDDRQMGLLSALQTGAKQKRNLKNPKIQSSTSRIFSLRTHSRLILPIARQPLLSPSIHALVIKGVENPAPDPDSDLDSDHNLEL